MSLPDNPLPVQTARQPLPEDIRTILRAARQQTWATVNTLMVQAYWRIGQRIVREEQQGKQRANYGAALIRNLARDLGEEFGKGVSIANLKNFRQFYLVVCPRNSCTDEIDGFVFRARRKAQPCRVAWRAFATPPWTRRHDFMCCYFAGRPLTFPYLEKSYAPRSQSIPIHWHLIMRMENPSARDWCTCQTTGHDWSKSTLGDDIIYHSGIICWHRLSHNQNQVNRTKELFSF